MSAWKDFVTAALLGTEKGGAAPAVPAALDRVLGPADALEREARFLTRAGAMALWRRAGWKPARGEAAESSPAPPETNPLISSASTAHLQAMLGGLHAEVLPEWLGEAARRERRLPPESLPALLEWARQNRTRRPLVLAAGGTRLRWLADQNPAWNFAADDSPEHWETGSREQRVAILRGWRAADPAAAREKLAEVWKSEPADARAAFLDVLAEGLGGADEPFLERALDDRAKEVRAGAVDLLVRLPGSAFVARMTARAEALLAFQTGGLLRRAKLEITLPGEPDAAARRDGLDPKTLPIPRQVGEKSYLLAQTLAAVPLRHWTERFQQMPDALLKAAARHEFASAVVSGWGLAATHQRDEAWGRAFFDEMPRLKEHLFIRQDGFFSLLPEAAQVEQAIAELQAIPLTINASRAERPPGHFLQLVRRPGYLPEALAQLIFDQLRQVPRDAASNLPNHFLPNFARELAAKTPPSLLAGFAAGWPADLPAFSHAFELLAFRRDALAALAQP